MAEPFLAEIRLFGFNFPPRGWAECNGQLLPISQNQSLYALLGTTYGGDGRTTFALPDLRGRVPVHTGDSETEGSVSHVLGSRGGEEGHVLGIMEVPAHGHTLGATDATSESADPESKRFAPAAVGGRTPFVPYGPPVELTPLSSSTVGQTGGGAHNNTQPYQVVNFCIAMQGVFPPRN